MTGRPADLPAAWAKALAAASSVPMTSTETRAFLAHLADWVTNALGDPDSARKAGIGVGSALVDSHHTQPESLAASITVLSEHLPPDISREVRTALYAGLAAGYAEALRERTRNEQETIRTAVLAAHRTSEERFRAVFRTASLGIGVCDGEGRILEINEPLAHMLGMEARAVRGLPAHTLRLPTDPPEYWEQFDAILAGRRRQMSGEKQFIRPDGEILWARVRASCVNGEDGKPALVVAMFEDVTERRRMTARLHYQAMHDPLTGLPNRAQILETLGALLEEGDPARRIGLCFLDIDGFKGVNDTLGHDAGDRLLIEIAARLRETTAPEGHLVGRMGGDEFVILLTGTSGPEVVTAVAEQVLAAIRRPLVLDGRELVVTASMGIVERPAGESKPAELLRAADITLYWAKSGGRDRWALFDAERNAREVARYALSQALPAALDRGELFVEYQPIVDLVAGRVRAFEALVRWNHPERGLLGPSRFVPLAEETGTIVALGRWVLGRAAQDAAKWPNAPDGRPVSVSVNVAVRQVHDPGLLHEVRDALEQSGLPPHLLQLEITESAVMDPGESGRPAIKTLQTLADLGVRIAIDDFGTGYSNLAYLRRLPAHTLKIDSSFVGAMLPAEGAEPGSATEEPIVTSLITLAHACGMALTAEGVETAAHARRLRELGADTGQGYLFSRPVPAEKVAGLITSRMPEF